MFLVLGICTGAAQLTKCPSLRAKGEDGSDGRRVGGVEGWRGCSAAETSHAGLPVWLRNEGKGHRHTHSCTRTDTHSGPSMAPRLISGAQRPQTEVAEGAQWEQGLKAWFTSALRTGERERERERGSGAGWRRRRGFRRLHKRQKQRRVLFL